MRRAKWVASRLPIGPNQTKVPRSPYGTGQCEGWRAPAPPDAVLEDLGEEGTRADQSAGVRDHDAAYPAHTRPTGFICDVGGGRTSLAVRDDSSLVRMDGERPLRGFEAPIGRGTVAHESGSATTLSHSRQSETATATDSSSAKSGVCRWCQGGRCRCASNANLGIRQVAERGETTNWIRIDLRAVIPTEGSP